MATFTVECHDGFDDLPGDVLGAFVLAEQSDFQAGVDWYRLLCATAVTPGERASLYVLRRNGAFAAALPLLISRTGFDLRALSNFYTTRFTPPAFEDVEIEGLAALLRHLRMQRPRASRIDISPLDKASRNYGLLQGALRRAGFLTFEYFCFGNWYLPASGDCDAFMAGRPGEVRNTLRRMSRRISQTGGHIEIVGSDGDIDSAIAAYSAVYASSWKQPEPFTAFMPALIRLCASKGWLRMGIAWLASKPIAVQLWVVAHGKASIFKLAYDSAYSSLSPGTLLTAALVRHVMDIDHVREVDYLTGDDAYKQAWMSHRRELWGLVGYDPRQLRGATLAVREASARGLKRVLHRSKPVPSRGAPTARIADHPDHSPLPY